jgi:hypothetical protein
MLGYRKYEKGKVREDREAAHDQDDDAGAGSVDRAC